MRPCIENHRSVRCNANNRRGTSLAGELTNPVTARKSPEGRARLIVMAKEFELQLHEGDRAPDFTVQTNDGRTVSLADFKGKQVVLYFYPRDDTPGCTKEACGFRDNFAAVEKRGAVVLGVSPDSVKSHQKFVEKFRLPFLLLADEDKKIAQAYGVWGERSFLGRKYMGVHRVTFLIGPDGQIKKIWPKVKAGEHAAEVLAAVSAQ
jgi:thioredoxin-dependent peroxiredoxin